MFILTLGAYGYWHKRAKQAEAKLRSAQATAQPEPEEYTPVTPCTKQGCKYSGKFNHTHTT